MKLCHPLVAHPCFNELQRGLPDTPVRIAVEAPPVKPGRAVSQK